jgi:hypothetical protein
MKYGQKRFLKYWFIRKYEDEYFIFQKKIVSLLPIITVKNKSYGIRNKTHT